MEEAVRETRNGRATRPDERDVHSELMRLHEAADSSETPAWEQRGTSVRAIEQQLAELWTHPDDRGRMIEGHLPRARASVLNLIVTVTDADAAERAVRTMKDLGVRHPSRAIVLVADPNASGEPIDARISTHCHTPHDDEERICYEEVVLTVRGDAANHLSGIVAPLLIHDLPTHVWWPGDPPWGDPVFEQLVAMADRLIVDSGDFGDLLLGYRRLASIRRRTGVGDLSWDRLGWWQELTAEFFDAPRFRRYLPNLNRLWLRYSVGPAGVDLAELPQTAGNVTPTVVAPLTQPLLFAGWIASRLGWKRDSAQEPLEDGRMRLRLEGRYEMVDLLLEAVETDRLPPGELVGMHLRSLGETGAAEFIIDRANDEATVATNADGMTALLRRVPMDQPRESDLLSQDLVADEHNPIYEASLRAAAVFLASVQPPEPSELAA
jgi:glucose-6-phosphate dehydrogenase assembly protein OpcA